MDERLGALVLSSLQCIQGSKSEGLGDDWDTQSVRWRYAPYLAGLSSKLLLVQSPLLATALLPPFYGMSATWGLLALLLGMRLANVPTERPFARKRVGAVRTGHRGLAALVHPVANSARKISRVWKLAGSIELVLQVHQRPALKPRARAAWDLSGP